MRSHDASYNIVYECKIALHLTVIEHLDWTAIDDRISKYVERHVRTPPGSIYSKETKASLRQSVQMRVRITHMLIGTLGGSVERNGGISPILDRKG